MASELLNNPQLFETLGPREAHNTIRRIIDEIISHPEEVMASYATPDEFDLPQDYIKALQEERKGLLRQLGLEDEAVENTFNNPGLYIRTIANTMIAGAQTRGGLVNSAPKSNMYNESEFSVKTGIAHKEPEGDADVGEPYLDTMFMANYTRDIDAPEGTKYRAKNWRITSRFHAGEGTTRYEFSVDRSNKLRVAKRFYDNRGQYSTLPVEDKVEQLILLQALITDIYANRDDVEDKEIMELIRLENKFSAS